MIADDNEANVSPPVQTDKSLVNFDSRVIRHISLEFQHEYFRIVRGYTCSYFTLDTFLTAK